MNLIKVETPGVHLAIIQCAPTWQITHHRLFTVSPENAPTEIVQGGAVTIWDVCFLEDLLQATNQSKGLLLDVGWHPHADPAGSFRLSVVRKVASQQPNLDRYDWDNPIEELRTRSVETILTKVRELLAS